MNSIDKLTIEMQAHNRLLTLLFARHNVNTWDKSDEAIIEEMKTVSHSVLEWAYNYPDNPYPLDVDRRRKGTV